VPRRVLPATSRATQSSNELRQSCARPAPASLHCSPRLAAILFRQIAGLARDQGSAQLPLLTRESERSRADRRRP